MNDRNAFLQGQGSPIKDDAPAPTQGWRGERAADAGPNGAGQRRTLEGSAIEVEEVSGVAFAEAQGLGDGGDEALPEPRNESPATHIQGGHDTSRNLDMTPDSPGGQSAGAPYPQPYKDKEVGKQQGGFMGHGGQSEIAYHGSGHLGEQTVEEDDNRNGVAESNS